MADVTAPDELAEAEQEIRDRLAECPRGDGGQPKLLMYHLVEILLAEYDRRGTELVELRGKLDTVLDGHAYDIGALEAELVAARSENDRLQKWNDQQAALLGRAARIGKGWRGERDVLSGLLRGMARRVVERRAYIGALCSEYDDMRAELRRVRFEWGASEQRVAAVRGAVAGWQEQLDAGEVFAGSPGDAVLCGVVRRLRAVLDGPAGPGLSPEPNELQTPHGTAEAPSESPIHSDTTKIGACAACGTWGPNCGEGLEVCCSDCTHGPSEAPADDFVTGDWPAPVGTATHDLGADKWIDDEPAGSAEAAEPATTPSQPQVAANLGVAEAGAPEPAPGGQLRKLNMDLAAARQVVAAVRRWTLASANEGPSRERQMVAALERHDERVREELRAGGVSTTPAAPGALTAAARVVLAEWSRMHPSGYLAMYPAMDALRAALAGSATPPEETP